MEAASGVRDREQSLWHGHRPRACVSDSRHLRARRVVQHAVRAATQEAVDRARRDQLPTLLEVRTYRSMGHSMSDAVSGTYRTKAELDEYMKRDPIMLLRMHMQEHGELTDEELQQLDADMKATVQDA